MKKKIIVVIACMVMICTLLPGTVFASEDATMRLGSGGIANKDIVYYGQYRTIHPTLEWQVLDADKTNNNVAGMFLITKDALGLGGIGLVKFNSDDRKGNTYQGSDAQIWCKGFENSALTDKELGAIIETSKNDEASGNFASSNNILKNDKVFFLSAEEANAYFADNDARKAKCKDDKGNESDAMWWLRSPCSTNYMNTGIVHTPGAVHFTSVTLSLAVRPAFNLDLNSILFSSAAKGGKSGTVGVDGLQQVLTEETISSWKLTLKDTTRDNFSAEITAFNNDTAIISYESASVGENEYISAIITDKAIPEADCNIKYYGRILKPTAADGTATLNLAGKYEGSDKLYVFSEQYNGDKKTDYASELKEVAIKKTPVAAEFSFAAPKNLIYDGKGKTAAVTPKTGITGLGKMTIKHYDITGNQLNTPPKEAGKYTVKIDVTAGNEYFAATDLTAGEWNFTITKTAPGGDDGNEPGTGDDSSMTLWIMLALIVALAATGTVIAMKKKQENSSL